MTADWPHVTLGSQVTFQRGFDLDRADISPGDVPVVASGGRMAWHSGGRPGPGVMIGRKGTLGTVFYEPGEYWPYSTTLWVKDFHGNDPRFVYYFLKSFPVARLDVGSANPTLNRNHLHPLMVRWPDLNTQTRIATLLDSLDDRIAAELQLRDKLDELLRSVLTVTLQDDLPRVDFASAGLGYALSEALEHASALQLRTGGWATLPLSEMCHRVARKPDDTIALGNRRLLDIGRLPRRCLVPESWGDGNEIVAASAFDEDDVLFGAVRAYFHKVVIAPFPGVTNSSVHVIRAKHAEEREYVSLLLASEIVVDHASRVAGGTTMPVTKWQDLSSLSVRVPPSEVRQSLSGVLRPVVSRLKAGSLVAAGLTELRDHLAPMLVSGKFTVDECLAIMEDGSRYCA